MAHDVFVSYSQGDKVTADAVVAGLERRGVRCWFAPRDILPGSTWGEAIVEAIAGCTAMVLVLSSDSNQSRQVLREVERAVAIDKVIIPFRIDEVVATGAMSYFLGTEHWLDALTPPLERHIEALTDTVQRILGTEGAARKAPPSAPPSDSALRRISVSRRTMAYAGGGALLLVLGLLLGISLMSGGSDDATTTSVAALDSTTSSTASATTTEATTIVATTEPTTTTTGVAETTTATTTTTEVTAGPPAGFDLFDGSRNGFTVALPDNWLAMDLTASDFQDVVDEMEGYLTPEEIEVIRQVIADGAELGLLGFGVTGDPNVNVLVMPLGPLDTLDLLEAMLPDQIATQPGIELESVERVDLNGVEGLLFVTRNASDAEGIQHQYYVLGDDLGYVATFTALTAGADVSVFAEIMRTFTLVG